MQLLYYLEVEISAGFVLTFVSVSDSYRQILNQNEFNNVLV